MSDNEMRKSVIEMRHCSKINQTMRRHCAAFGGESIMDLSDWRLTLAHASRTFSDAASRAVSAA